MTTDLTSKPYVSRSYEEVEKRRNIVMRGKANSSPSATILLVVFLATATLTFYLLLIPWTGIFPTNYPLAEVTALVASLSLFGNRALARSGRMSNMRAALLALTDTLAFGGFLGLAAWTLVFPLLYPFPPEIVLVGVFALIITAAMAVVLRFAQPAAGTRNDGAYSDVEFTLKQLGEAVEELSRKLPQGERNVDPAVSERLATMLSEVAAMRKDFATLKTNPSGSQQTFAVNPSVSGTRMVKEPQARPTVIFPQGSSFGPSHVTAGGERSPSNVSDSGISTPDSTIDNPWLDVLTRRKKKKE